MKHWKLALVGMTVAVTCLVGCTRQVFITEADAEHYRELDSRIGAGPDLDRNPGYALNPGPWNPPIPPTVDSPDRPVRYITLQEAFAIALERGSVGTEGVTVATIISGSLGIPNEGLPEFSGFSTDVSSTDSIRVFSLDPALVGANVESSLSKFDARWFTSLTWNKTDNAVSNILASFQNGDGFNMTSGVLKPLPTGGVTGITWITDYTKLSTPPFGTVNPAWRPQLQLTFEQPLLRNYGIEINQLNSSHPGSLLQPQSPSVTERQVGTEGILITRVRVDQQRAQFQKMVNFMMLNVEAAYWNLYAAYGALWANDRALAEALELWTNFRDRVDRGLALPQDERRVLAQLEQFRAQRFGVGGASAGSLLNVLERERQLRLLLGLPEDGMRLVPVDAPTLAPYQPDWGSAVQEALSNRPELILTREQLKARQFDVMIQKNQLRPDLRFISSYNMNGVGDTLNGPLNLGGLPHNALASLWTDKFNTWQFGLRLDVPIGFRDAHAQLRIARLNLARAFLNLREAEQRSLSTLQGTYSAVFAAQHAIQAWQAAVKAAVEEYNLTRAREDIVPDKSVWLEQLLTAQQVAAQSASSYYSAIAAYNTALAGWQFAKGTIMQYDNAMISEGPLPAFAQQRAVDHERERSAAIKLRERANGPMNAVPGAYPINWDPNVGVMPLITDVPPSVPQMMQGNAPINGTSGKNSAPPAMPMVPAGNASPYGTGAVAPIPPGSTVTPAATSYQPWPSR
jgi:outer membrane protein TolC